MFKFFKYLLISVAIILSIFILFTSFNISSQSKMLDTGNLKSRKFYVKKEILPDHSLYPLLMVFDRLRLSMADRERRLYLLTAYANRRLFYATRLINKGEEALALTTFSKSQKYLNQALLEARLLREENTHNQTYDQLIFFILEEVEHHQEVLEKNLDFFTEKNQSELKSLNEETLLLRGCLDQ
jgi:hypothetical protein